MKLLRSFVLLASVLAVPALLSVVGVSAPPDKKAEKASTDGDSLVRVATGPVRPNGQTAHLAPVSAKAGTYSILHAEFDSSESCQAFNVENAYPLVRFQKWADILIRDDEQGDKALKDMQSAKGFVWLDFGDETFVPPPSPIGPAEKTREVYGESIVRGGVGGNKGQGVIVAVIDSGIDFHHPDFIKYEDGKPTSRVLYFWDTYSDNHARGVGAPAPFSFPNKVPIGTVYSRDDLTQELRSPRRRIHVWDTNGHGTSCAGVAAGNGNAAGEDASKRRYHVGVAPEADIIAVRVAQSGGYNHSALIGAICEWLEQVGAKEKKPIVLSCSYGGQRGGRDGTNIIERQLDARFGPDVKDSWCRAVCISAGNNGMRRWHEPLTLGGSDSKKILRWQGSGGLSIYFDTDDPKDIRVAPVEEGLSAQLPLQQGTIGVHKITGKVFLTGSLPGNGRIALYSASGKTVKADAYLDVGPSSSAEFPDGDPLKYLSTPATTGQAITVASYDFNDAFNWLGQVLSYNVVALSPRPHFERMTIGSLSNYSSRGPRRLDDDRMVKPDVAAPGRFFSTAATVNIDDTLRDSTGYYTRFSGTSAAAPYAAGVVALMLQKDKDLTNVRIKEMLARNVRKIDADGKPLDRNGWGNGKLDLASVKRILEVP